MNKLKLTTHSGSFHADDIFASATLALYLEKKGQNFEIIRTRDSAIIETGDFVFDVGGVYDEEKNLFDHHQKGGAGEREGIPYSSFGLVWKKFGAELCADKKVADSIERKLVMPVDANDNAVDLYKANFSDILPYTVQDVFATFSPTSLEGGEGKDAQFLRAHAWAKEILSREIKKAQDQIEITKIIQNFYQNSADKRLVVIDAPKVSRFEIWDALEGMPEPLYAVYGDEADWSVVAMRKERNSFGNKKDLPASWGGLPVEELRSITGVPDAMFCHNNLFLAVAKSKEGALKLAELALMS